MVKLVIDITYLCNSNCNYCQWSASNSSKVNQEIPIKQLLLSKQSIESLGITRIVITGGEPLLAENLNRILEYYNDNNLPIRLISNGIDLNQKRIDFLVSKGVNEFVISIDAISYEIYSKNRGVSEALFNKIMKNMVFLSDFIGKIGGFLGLNVVLTNTNCNWVNISSLLNFAEERNINQIKFQPVFDDGYLSQRAPELALTRKSLKDIEIIKTELQDLHLPRNFSNPAGFWLDLIEYLSGTKLSPIHCNIADHAILLHGGMLKFCYWCKHANYGFVSDNLTQEQINSVKESFKNNLYKCEVLPQCFCLQPIDHEWIRS